MMIKTISFPKEVEERVSRIAIENRRSFSAQVVYICEAYLKANSSEQIEDTEAAS